MWPNPLFPADSPSKTSFFVQSQGKGMKMLTSKKMRQGLPVTLKQEKAGNTSKNLLNGILKVMHALYQVKEVSKMCIKYSEIKNFIN